ncbi:MAG: AAA family ATPase, partial [Desulfobacteraceae bacterium]|nr:AAA family ATPase [Desulfobacteraceae bacterium]
MAKRITREISYVRLPEGRIREIENLVASWPYETKAFMRSRLNQYKPPSDWLNSLLEILLSLFMDSPEKRFRILQDPDILTDWQRRFELSGQTNPQEAWNRILEKEVSARDYTYMLALLDADLTDVHVPTELRLFFEKIYRAFIRKEYLSDPGLPKAPLLLVVGSSGSGKTATMMQAVEDVIFGNQVLPEVDLKRKKEELLANEPFWKSIEEIDPTLAVEIARRKRLKFYKWLSSLPIVRRI